MPGLTMLYKFVLPRFHIMMYLVFLGVATAMPTKVNNAKSLCGKAFTG
jgi:hypothetical protein